ncbi:MAG: hypothetical protein HW416_2271 [Chloroflexi bacterium]|nr:hypothetical protein [Chloroflexota bacterium]
MSQAFRGTVLTPFSRMARGWEFFGRHDPLAGATVVHRL